MTAQAVKRVPRNYAGPDRRQSKGVIQREEFSEFVKDVGERMDSQDKILTKLDTAMFAPSTENEFGSVGVMTFMRKVDSHVDVMCNITRLATRATKWIAGTLTGLAGLLVAGRAAGWW